MMQHTSSRETGMWESRLLSLASEALEGHLPIEPIIADTLALEAAYVHCDNITYQHSRTFYLASSLLPPLKRRGARALYAFCRTSDDIVDRNPEDARQALQDWRRRILSTHPPQEDPVALAWADTRARFQIPRLYAEQLIDGVARDLHQNRYHTFEELSGYCYGVASTVGLMAMHITGYRGPEALPYAVKLGIALQLTNILRDVGEDWRNGRLYLPLEELDAFGVTEEDIATGSQNPGWQALLAFQIERNRSLYAESIPGITLLDADGRFAILAAAELYRAILEDIETNRGDVFSRRAHLSAWDKMRRLPGIWQRARRLE